MGNQGDNKFTWVIKDYCTWRSDFVWSDEFVIGGCKWYLQAYFKRDRDIDVNCLYLDLGNADFESAMRFGNRCSNSVQFTLTVVNQLSRKHSQVKAANHWFDMTIPGWEISMIPLTKPKLHAKDGGFLVNNELEIVAVIDVVDVPEGSVNANKPLKRLADLVDVNGFQVPPSQVDFVRRIFELHPETALDYRTKNQDLRRIHMIVLLFLTRMFFNVPLEESIYDMSDIEGALAYMKTVGFKLDWLEKKLDEVKENKKKCARVTELEQQLQDLRKQLEQERAEIKKTAPDLSFIDVV